jgi:hypothetical protein
MLDRSPQINTSEALIAGAPADEEPWRLVTMDLGGGVQLWRNTEGSKNISKSSPAADRTGSVSV